VILAIDQGTTGTTCIAFDERGRPVGRAYREFEPSMSEDERETLLAGWARALERARSNEEDRSG
jgi:glycerol kinase